MRRAHEYASGANLLIDMRKGEPTTSLGLATKHSRGECPRPGAATRYLSARRLIAGQLLAPKQSTVDCIPWFFIRANPTQGYSGARTIAGPYCGSKAESPGRRLMGIRSITPINRNHFLGAPIYRGLGEICARQTCLLKANHHSRPNH
jgi:hypothetical protein